MGRILNLRYDINRNYFTTVNYNKSNCKQNQYIVIHYVGADGSALANAKYFQSVYRGASAHAFVDHSGSIYQIVNWDDVAWHCGAQSYKHKTCRNSNSIGIELCCYKDMFGQWYFNDITVERAADLVVALMFQYDIPIDNVIRHYDVTGKICPEPYVRNAKDWNAFLKLVKKKYNAILGKWATIKQAYLRDKNYAIVKSGNTKLATLVTLRKKTTIAINGSVVFKPETSYTLVGVKQDAKGNIWAINKSGYVLPIEFAGVERSIKL